MMESAAQPRYDMSDIGRSQRHVNVPQRDISTMVANAARPISMPSSAGSPMIMPIGRESSTVPMIVWLSAAAKRGLAANSNTARGIVRGPAGVTNQSPVPRLPIHV
jgi:hypothetical protein